MADEASDGESIQTIPMPLAAVRVIQRTLQKWHRSHKVQIEQFTSFIELLGKMITEYGDPIHSLVKLIGNVKLMVAYLKHRSIGDILCVDNDEFVEEIRRLYELRNVGLSQTSFHIFMEQFENDVQSYIDNYGLPSPVSDNSSRPEIETP